MTETIKGLAKKAWKMGLAAKLSKQKGSGRVVAKGLGVEVLLNGEDALTPVAASQTTRGHRSSWPRPSKNRSRSSLL